MARHSHRYFRRHPVGEKYSRFEKNYVLDAYDSDTLDLRETSNYIRKISIYIRIFLHNINTRANKIISYRFNKFLKFCALYKYWFFRNFANSTFRTSNSISAASIETIKTRSRTVASTFSIRVADGVGGNQLYDPIDFPFHQCSCAMHLQFRYPTSRAFRRIDLVRIKIEGGQIYGFINFPKASWKP